MPDERQSLLFVTDEKSLARWAGANGMACIGVSAQEDGFFEGVELVAEDPETLELRELEEYLAHYHGIPAVIARTRHLLLREICPSDFERLNAISRQAGMEKARAETNGESGFEADRLEAYIAHQYRMYGYGLWSVLLPDKQEGAEQVIGCCGFSECSSELLLCEQNVRSEEAWNGGDSLTDEVRPQTVLELQYMLDAAFRCRGYGTEMCQAALDYAYQWLEAEAVWIRVKKENTVGVKFAQSLGFRICRGEERESELWMRHERTCWDEERESELWMWHERTRRIEEAGECGNPYGCYDLEGNNAV